MFRGFVYLILTIFAITFIRAVIGLIGKAVAQLFEPENREFNRSTPGRKSSGPQGGELVQDPVCGIYVSTETKLRTTSGGKNYYFCSEACKDKFNA